MMKVDKRIETVLDVLQHRADKCDVDLEVEQTFDDDLYGMSSVIVRNVDSETSRLTISLPIPLRRTQVRVP